MEYILLLTACINPDGMPFTCLADVGVRKKQYIEALNFYLKNTTRKIVFVENSGTDISSSFKDFQHRIEFLCFDGNLCFDKRKGKYAYIDYRQLAAQAMQLLYKNERYGLNDENEKVFWQNNTEFE